MFLNGVLAGVLIGIGDIVMMEVENPYIAALCFSMALLCVIELQCRLYTGMIGNIVKRYNLIDVIVALIANVIGCCSAMLCYICMNKNNYLVILTTANKKFGGTSFLNLYFAGLMCGVMIHVAVTAKKTAITILAIMVFILCGFRHSIADAGYAFLSFEPSYMLLWLGVLLGNTSGGVLTEAITPSKE